MSRDWQQLKCILSCQLSLLDFSFYVEYSSLRSNSVNHFLMDRPPQNRQLESLFYDLFIFIERVFAPMMPDFERNWMAHSSSLYLKP